MYKYTDIKISNNNNLFMKALKPQVHTGKRGSACMLYLFLCDGVVLDVLGISGHGLILWSSVLFGCVGYAILLMCNAMYKCPSCAPVQ